MNSITDAEKHRLNDQLIKLGDMMGDGLHQEPGGKWIEREYRKVCKALGIIPQRRPVNNQAINDHMAKRVRDVPCQQCGGELKQTRSGSMRAKCRSCGAKYQLMTWKRKR